MLKIKDCVDLKELEKFGLKKRFYYKSIVLEIEARNFDIAFDIESGLLRYINGSQGYDVIFDLIQAGLVEKVEE